MPKATAKKAISRSRKSTEKDQNASAPMKSSMTPASFGSVFKKIPRPTSYTPVLVFLLIVAAFLLGILWTKLQSANNLAAQQTAQGGQQGTAAQPTPSKVNVAVGHFPVLGNKKAKVTVIEFADFQCPYCHEWFLQVEPNLIKDYVNTGKVAFYFRTYAFLGQESTNAAEAAECANAQGKFWQFHDYLYEHQGPEDSGTFAIDKLEGFAATLGLNTTDFNSCLESGKYSSAVTADTADGTKAGVSGTPTVFINGVPIIGAQPYSAFKAIVDQDLAQK